MNEFIKLQLSMLKISMKELSCPPYSFKCNIFGHLTKKDSIKNMEWKQFDDGLRYREAETICTRCKSKLLLIQYPYWSNVFVQKICDENN